MREVSKERRAHPRFTIPDTTVCFLLSGSERGESAFSKPCPLLDVSKGGVSFLADYSLETGRAISVRLDSPEIEEALRLEGRVVHCRVSEIEASQYYIGVRFQPFEGKKGSNSPEALKVMERLEKAYCSPKSLD